MPAPSRTKAEVKYNVTTDFPHLGLHVAAATGNVGLVKYALSHGQPINSVLDGVLPLHAACSGGNDLVVRLLIEHGADVNAPRLPRRYSNDKHRDASAPIVGTSGSTPLHFAAANGHTTIVATLLLHGAHAHRPDKHGITPEMLARQNGQLECADILCQWELNKDSDLKEREAILGEQPPRSISNPSDTFETLSRKRIHVKRSIDNAFSLFRSDSHLKSSTSASPPPSLRNHTDQPSYASKPLGDYTFYPVDSDPTSDVSERRPSLPHLHMNVFKVSPTSRAPPSPRRPRSAGTDSEPPAPPSNHPRKLGTKYSLLHLFRKAHPTGDVLTSTSHSSITPDPLHPAISPSSPGYTSTLPIPTHRSTSDSQALSSSPNAAHSSSSLGPSSNHYGIHGADTSVHRTDLTSSVDVHRATPHRQQPYPRGPFASGFNTPGGVYQSEVAVVRKSETSLTTDGFLPRRSSPHGLKGLRFDSTSSRGGGIRLRDDSSTARSSAMAGPKGRSSSVSSARSDGGRGVRSSTQVPESAPAGTSDFRGVHPDADGGEDEEEYGIPIERSHFSQGLREFGSPRLAELRTEGHRSVASSTSSFEQHGMLAPDVGLDVQPDGNVSSAPPRVPEYPFSIDRPPSSDVDGRSKHLVVHPPPLSPSPSPSPAPAPVPTPANVPPLMEGVDNRGRGDSISSVSTNGSQPLSSSGTTATSSSSITTPGIASLGVTYPMGHGRKWDVDGSMFLSKEEGLTNPAIADAVDEFGALGHIGGGGTAALTNDRNVSIGERRSHTPLDINIRSISSHAQAEALVERAQRSILEMKDYEMPLHYHLDDDDQTPLSAGLITAGWTPLSAKLAAYGESLAIERKLKQEEEARRGSGCDEIRDGGISVGEEEAGNGEGGEDRAERVEHVENTVAKNASKSRKAGLDRQFSLEQKTSAGSHSRVVVPRRPNTSSGTTTDGYSSNQYAHEGLQSQSPTSMGSVVSPGVSSPLKLPSSLPLTQDEEEVSDDEYIQPIAARPQTPHVDVLCETVVTADSDSDENGTRLCRVSTAPSDSACERQREDQARHVASANKLARMGFAARGDVRHGVAARPVSPFAGSKPRFGGFKTLMQTLKGRP